MNCRYYSYGASLEPSSWSVFAKSHAIIKQMEGGLNDGLVRSVISVRDHHNQSLTSSAYLRVNGATTRALLWVSAIST